MKKVIALILAGVLCATAAYTALAAEEDENEANPIIVNEEEEKTPEEKAAEENLLKALEGDKEAQEIADEIVNAVKKGAAAEDINGMLLALTDYINGKGYDVGQIRNGSKTKDFVGDFLEDCGVDPAALNKALKGADEVYNNVFGDNKPSNGNKGNGTGAGTDLDIGGSPEYYGVDSTTIPDTGFDK